MPQSSLSSETISELVSRVVHEQPVLDAHTHLFAPSFGNLLLWGVDHLLTYHYLIAESLRAARLPYETFWAMSAAQQADFIWRTLFLERSPVSEACRGVVTTLNMLGLDLASRNLKAYREYFAGLTVEEYLDKVFTLANVQSVVMTNDPFDPSERPVWLNGYAGDSRFHAALRIDPLLNGYEESGMPTLKALGYDVDAALSEKALSEIRRFLTDWVRRMKPKYMAVSLPSDFIYPEDSARSRVIERCILPVSQERNVPFALMIGVRRQVNPHLRSGGDGVESANLRCLERLCGENPDNKFLATLLSRENQHQLCVLGRKFSNLMVFGCWWFLNNPSIIEEITRERLELLGLSVIPQHSDARILDQLLYKWKHSKEVIGKVLVDKYQDVLASGWTVTEEEIRRDVADLFGGNFDRFIGEQN